MLARMSLKSWSHQPTMHPASPSKRLVRSKSGLRIVCQHERHSTPWAIEEPHWIKDEEVMFGTFTGKDRRLRPSFALFPGPAVHGVQDQVRLHPPQGEQTEH